jgi:hypothetical protein
VTQALDRVRQAARQRKKEKFTALLHHLSTDLFWEAFLALKRDAAPGVDDLTWRAYAADLEGKLHWVRDVTMNEDRCRVRVGARALAAIRNLVLSLIRARGWSVPEARENLREDRAQAIAIVTGRIL